MARSSLHMIKEGLLHLLYPRLCEGCRSPLLASEEVLCTGCALQLPETYYHDHAENETSLRFSGRIPFLYATSYAYFSNEGLLQHLLHGLKYGGRKETGVYLGRRLGLQLCDASWGKEPDVLIPVPLHPAREAKRGYNQSALIAKGIGMAMGLPVMDRALCRVRHTESQTHKTREERLTNMARAFAVTDKNILKNRHVLLVDDVLTTGATLESCALALLEVEGLAVSIATIGIA